MVSKMWYGKMSGRLIPMPCVGYSPPGGVHSVQCTALLRSPLAAMLGPTQALPFADEQELGEAWHAVPGFTRAVPTAQQMQSLLVNNLVFALRCAASPDSFFFGPTRDLLLTSSRRLRVQLNLSRLRKCVQWTGCIACWHKRTSRERLYAPGGLGFAAAQAEFHALA